jgi:hypothetical protein
MGKLWYVSAALASTAVARRFMRGFRQLVRHLFLAFGALTTTACAGPSASAPTGGSVTPGAAVVPNEAGSTANLGGSRCHGAVCTCRNRAGDPAENPPPNEAHKRFEIRIGAGGGPATLTSPTLGELSSGPDEACFYVDVVPGTAHEVSFVARERRPEEGVSPVLEIAEYGPKGPWWYEVLVVKCEGPGGHCNRDGADAWSAELKTRKRGRIDPCGSSVIKNLKWDTTGGTGVRELGLFADFKVTFTLDVKRFATQFQPGSTECLPK